jgi:hypothetical protein
MGTTAIVFVLLACIGIIMMAEFSIATRRVARAKVIHRRGKAMRRAFEDSQEAPRVHAGLTWVRIGAALGICAAFGGYGGYHLLQLESRLESVAVAAPLPRATDVKTSVARLKSLERQIEAAAARIEKLAQSSSELRAAAAELDRLQAARQVEIDEQFKFRRATLVSIRACRTGSASDGAACTSRVLREVETLLLASEPN